MVTADTGEQYSTVQDTGEQYSTVQDTGEQSLAGDHKYGHKEVTADLGTE